MGDFFEDLGKRITETAGAVTKKTEEVVETQKIKSQIRVEERNKERDLQHLGKLVYTSITGSGVKLYSGLDTSLP